MMVYGQAENIKLIHEALDQIGISDVEDDGRGFTVFGRVTVVIDELLILRAENARLDQALADTAAQLTDAVQRAQEAEYNLHLMTKQADAFHVENGRLRQQQPRIITIARPYNGGLDCEGDGSGPGCENRAVWEIQDMQDDGSNYVYVCDAHLGDYQKWAAGDGRSPMVFEKK